MFDYDHFYFKSKVLYFRIQIIIICHTVIVNPASLCSNTTNLAHAAPVHQIQASFIELDCWAPPRPPLSPQGPCKCVCVSKKLKVRSGMCVGRVGGISL